MNNVVFFDKPYSVDKQAVGASFDDFGKTVFLHREEAEAALAKMDGDGNA